MQPFLCAAGIVGLLAVAGAALAQSPATAPATGRFTMQPVDGGMLRLDTENGTMSMCRAQSGGQWACTTLPDERAALDKEISRLVQENKDLQVSVKRLEELNGIPSDNRSQRRAETIPLPQPQDVDKAMDYIHSMVKKFKEKLKEFEDLDGKRTERL